ncbi:hypothetical protein, partial [Burkholderia lata]|uniref:hypothetical protein n=1 Tax=Burkholderia lata (strain ATCC 17760 / DSM 23089 / LMG 22485 / NCIMB 9086 / R18194 / 383) TaxID=482957 RepID=UPI00158196D4
ADDRALLDAYRQASGTNERTAQIHAGQLAHLASWLRATPDAQGRARPTLSELKDELVASGARALDNPHVHAFRNSQAGTPSARRDIGAALDALVRGNTAQRHRPSRGFGF